MPDLDLPDLGTPQVADDLARFGQAAEGPAQAATVNYSVPLPGSYSLDRILPLETPASWFEVESASMGASLQELGIVEVGADARVRRVDGERLAQLFETSVPDSARPAGRRVLDADGNPEPRPQALANPEAAPGQPEERAAYLQRLAQQQAERVAAAGSQGERTIRIARAGLGQSMEEVDWSPETSGTPRLALVESWEVRSFLGDYGLGRTLQTFSLLPGERTTIALETWRTDAVSREDGSSVFDSSDASAQSRFTASLAQQSGSAFQDQGGWSVSVGAKLSAGINLAVVSGSASLEAGFAANHQEARQRFSTSVSNTAQEHAAQVNNSRRQGVESRTATSTSTGSSTSTLREIANPNLRRVLNFVFRELNQTYETLTVLRTVKVAFYNGNVGSAEVVELADLRKLLARHIVADQREAAARHILAMVCETLDQEGTPVPTLQRGTRPNGDVYLWSDVGLRADGTLNVDENPLDGRYSWRFKPGQLGAGNTRVDGVIVGRTSIVLRTDSVVAEALLGKADALDPYASALQALDLHSRAADVDWRLVETRKIQDALALVAATGTTEKVAAYERLLGDKPDIEVVPAAATSNGNG